MILIAAGEGFNVFPFSGDFDPKTPFQIPFDTTALESKFVQAYVQNWNLTVERKLGADWLLRVGYVGTKATHLMADYDQNAPIYDFSQDPRPESGNYRCAASPFVIPDGS